MSEEVVFSRKSMGWLRPVKPEQHNYSDGGIFLLHYVEKIFSCLPQFLWPETVNTLNENWFPLNEVFKKHVNFYRTQVNLGSDLWVRMSVRH